MRLFGGKNAKKTSSSSTKRHFTVVMGNKEHGLYVSSSPSSAARKAVSKLCASNKSKKVQFSIREITQGSKKKTYGPYSGYIEKLKEPIELKGRVIKYKPVAKLSGKTGAKKGGMRGGGGKVIVLKIVKSDNNFNDILDDSGFHDTVLQYINPDRIYMQPLMDKDRDGKFKFMGLCKSAYHYEDNTVKETPLLTKAIRRLQFILFKLGYHDVVFSIFISYDKQPYQAIESNKENKYLPLEEKQLNKFEREIYMKDPKGPMRGGPMLLPPNGVNRPFGGI